jgi:hypothetical protein
MSTPSGSSKPTASGASDDSHTIRGRLPNAPLDKPAKSEAIRHSVPFGPPLMGRARANSLRRLDEAALRHLAASPRLVEPAVQFGAVRELDVRQAMAAESQAQFAGHLKPMAATGPATMETVTALRFAASLAEEAQSELKTMPQNKRRLIGQIGVASVNGHLGLGISGRSDARDFGQAVEGRMLELQEHYDGTGGSANWSTRLVPVHAPEVTSQGMGQDICAAKRASAVAHSVNGTLPPLGQYHRDLIPSPDALLEVMQGATSEFGKNIEAHSVLTGRSPPPEPADNPFAATVAGRPRSQSIGSMASSCDTCMQEHEQFMQTRSRSGTLK